MGWSHHHPRGLLHHDASRAFPGYTLIAMSGGDTAYLIDMEGRLCHRWRRAEGLAYGYLLPNGSLLCRSRGAGGTGAPGEAVSGIMELDWDGNAVWEHWDPRAHHDFERLANGHTLMIRSDPMPQEVARRVRGGPGDVDAPMAGEMVREVDAEGATVREWSMWQALGPEQDAMCPWESRSQWLHQNSLTVTPDGDLLVSFRQIDTVGIVDRETGRFTWKWGLGEISHQHHPTWLDGGNVLIFDNGPHRGQLTYSRVVEVNPKTDAIEWEYVGDPPISFYSYHISGCERQPNGNTLITEGAPGRIFEVTPEKEIVWEYVNPHRIPGGAGFGSGSPHSVFRAHRYAADHPALAGRDLTPEAEG